MNPQAPELTADLIRRFDVSGPRYTSYPTADRFVEAFGHEQYGQALEARAQAAGVMGGRGAPLSLYVHIPFCESVCYYCACNKVITKHHDRAGEYLVALKKEIDLHVDRLGAGHAVTQLHFGGGSPTFLNDAELAHLMSYIKDAFRLIPGAEISIEVDPRTVTRERLQHLWQCGFNRLSFGVQDFNPDVQKAVHRVQSHQMVVELMQAARDIGFESINVDLIYGLPKQTAETFATTVAQVSALRPDRIALYAYAHLPARFKPQRRINAEELPPADQKVAMLVQAVKGFQQGGYTYIGMDHFALDTDALAVAKRQGRLHRNFQGYSTQPDCDLVALGVSAIGRIGPIYSQNAKTLEEYYDALSRGELPVQRGLSLSRDDLVRRAVIMALMCQGRVDYESIELAHLVNFQQYFSQEMQEIDRLAGLGLVQREPDGLRVTAVGWYFVRAVAMVFDRYLQTDRNRERFSKII
ncbi:MAG: oxygen-independent coproporphyrinogen III oxidase [Burkholderiaceae bacterium]|nr:MAG: oxygen-independent coproporphyrinogen III oxidase [Burkholderiaceae bacterium]